MPLDQELYRLLALNTIYEIASASIANGIKTVLVRLIHKVNCNLALFQVGMLVIIHAYYTI